MSDADDIRKELLKERSLYELWKYAVRINLRGINVVVLAIVFFSMIFAARYSTYDELKSQIVVVVDLGITFATEILGFLIAGFTVFATLSRVDMFLEMQRRREAETGLTWLKYNFSAFAGVFVEYIVFLALCFSIKLFCFPGGPVARIFQWLQVEEPMKAMLARFILIILSVFLAYVVMQLKSFVWNIYHAIMTSIAWEAVRPKKEE